MKLKHEKINLPEEINIKCITLLQTLKLRYGAIDFILDDSDNYLPANSLAASPSMSAPNCTQLPPWFSNTRT